MCLQKELLNKMWYCTPVISKLGGRRTRAAGTKRRLQPGHEEGMIKIHNFSLRKLRKLKTNPAISSPRQKVLRDLNWIHFFSDSRFETTTYNCFPEHTWNIPERHLRVMFPCSQLLVLMRDTLIRNPAFGNNSTWPSLPSPKPVQLR